MIHNDTQFENQASQIQATLPLFFLGKGDVKGLEFNQIKRTKTTAFYKVDNDYYEVFIIKTQDMHQRFIDGEIISYEAKEIYPCSEKFGIFAWTYRNYKEAEAKFNEISNISRSPKQLASMALF